jgi:hypothetical protein
MPFLKTSLVGLYVLTVLNWAAAQSNVIFPITNPWRYEQTVNLDGVNWQSPAFNDSVWPIGIGLLYVEDNVAVTPRNTPLLDEPPTTFARIFSIPTRRAVHRWFFPISSMMAQCFI